ncbi:hypothetical protein FOBRF1_009470 [Fusarium oxysporum]
MIGNATVSVLSPSRASGLCITLICNQYLPKYGHSFEESRSHPGSPRNFKILSQVSRHRRNSDQSPRTQTVMRTQSPHRLRCTRDASKAFTV